MRYKDHLKKLSNTVYDILVSFQTSLKSELLFIKDCLVRKAAVISKLEDDVLDNIEDEEGIAEEINTAEAFKNFFCKRVIESEHSFHTITKRIQ